MPSNDTGLLISVDPSQKSVLFDDMFYAVSGAVPYESEGTYAALAGKGGQIKYTGAGSDGSRARLNQSITQVPIDPTKGTRFDLYGATLQTTKVSNFVGMFGALPTAADPSIEPAEGIYFRRLDTTSVAHWFAVCRTGSVETAVDTGIAGDANNHDFKILIKNGIPTFYLDNVQVAQISTNITTTALAAGIVCVGLEAVAKAVSIDTLFIENMRV